MVARDAALARAYAHCERLARDHYENFPVASRLLPPAVRPHVAAIYAFARRADDFADEPGLPDERRLELLDGWLAGLHAAAGASGASSPDAADGIFLALGHTIREHALPVRLFEDLLSAFRQDVTTTRYEAWQDLLDYCRRSANPVGRLVLRVAGCADARADAAADAVCTALQLTNFWQDLARDWARGRLYVPLEDLARAGAREDDLGAGRMTPAWRAVMAQMIGRTHALFAEGRGICEMVRGRLRWELRLTWLGGARMLDKVGRARQTSFDQRPTLGAGDFLALARNAVWWKRVSR